MSTSLERNVESYLVDQATRRGGVAIKLHPYVAGLPDRVVLLPGGFSAFVEVKRPTGGRLQASQKRWQKRLQGLGHRAVVVKNRDEVDELMETLSQ